MVVHLCTQVTINVRDLNKFAGESGEVSLEMLKENGLLNLSMFRAPTGLNWLRLSVHAPRLSLVTCLTLSSHQVVARISFLSRSWEPVSLPDQLPCTPRRTALLLRRRSRPLGALRMLSRLRRSGRGPHMLPRRPPRPSKLLIFLHVHSKTPFIIHSNQR